MPHKMHGSKSQRKSRELKIKTVFTQLSTCKASALLAKEDSGNANAKA